MAYLCVDKDGTEWISYSDPIRYSIDWFFCGDHVKLPKGSIAKLIGRELTWNEEPIELK